MIWPLLLGLLCSCGSGQREQSQSDWFVAALSSIAHVADSDARTQAYPGSGKGPSLVDLNELSKIAFQITGERLTTRSIAAGLPANARDIPRERAITCTSAPVSCEVMDDGVFLQLDSLVRRGDRVQAGITTVTTERSMPGRPATCHRQLIIEATRNGREWKVIDTKLWATC